MSGMSAPRQNSTRESRELERSEPSRNSTKTQGSGEIVTQPKTEPKRRLSGVQQRFSDRSPEFQADTINVRGAKFARRFLKGTGVLSPVEENMEGFAHIFLHPMNIGLVFLPLGIAAHYLHWGSLWAFWLNFLALIPLAKILGDATEELAASLKNDMVAGLLNATFGNAVEVVFTIQSLREGLTSLVKMTLLGSVLSNCLLVLGMSFFFGGIMTTNKAKKEAAYDAIGGRKSTFNFSEKIQSFSMLGALVNTSMLLVSCLTFSLLTIFRVVLEGSDQEAEIVLAVSRITAVIISLAYVAFVFFQLVTHKDAMADEEDDEEDGDHMTVVMSTILLFVTTAVVAYCSELLVHAVKGVVADAHLSEHFIGIVLLPIVGNACEHAAAVRFAVQDKLGLSVSIAVGSSTQIALFVVPLSVILGWSMQVPMNLNFGMFHSTVITLCVIVILSMVVDGHSNWLQGYLLVSVYCILSVMYWYLPNDVHDAMD